MVEANFADLLNIGNSLGGSGSSGGVETCFWIAYWVCKCGSVVGGSGRGLDSDGLGEDFKHSTEGCFVVLESSIERYNSDSVSGGRGRKELLIF